MDVSNIFNFFCSGEGKGESGATARGGSVFLLEIRGGGVSQGGGGREGPGWCLREFLGGGGGGGVNIIFFGAEMSTKST